MVPGSGVILGSNSQGGRYLSKILSSRILSMREVCLCLSGGSSISVLEERRERGQSWGTFQAKEEQVKRWNSCSEDWNSIAMLEHKTEEKHLLGLRAVSIFLQTSKMIWIQECGMIFLRVRSNSWPQPSPSSSEISENTQEQYANVAFPIKYKENCHGSQGMGLPSECNHWTGIALLHMAKDESFSWDSPSSPLKCT